MKVDATRRQMLMSAGAAGTLAALPNFALAKGGPVRVPNSVNLTGDLPDAREYFLTEPSEIIGAADAAAFWIWDNCGQIGFPFMEVSAVSPMRALNQMDLAVTFPGGRILRSRQPGTPRIARDRDGRSSIIGAGPMRLDCVVPYRRYRATYKGVAIDTSFQALLQGQDETRLVDLEYEIDMDTIVPPWAQGSLPTGFERWAREGVQGRFIGGDRVEQLMRASGHVKVGGVDMNFRGGALRVRRQGLRDLSGMWGHNWQSAVFPSGRAFGYIANPPRTDGDPSYNEGYIFLRRGEMLPARVVEAPWLNAMHFNGDDVSFVLESKLGRTRIGGKLIMSVPVRADKAGADVYQPRLQSIVRFNWDGEETYGMTDRSIPAAMISNYPAR